VKNVVLTAGKYGAFASSGGKVVPIPSHAKKIVDSTGAGDVFGRGCITAYLKVRRSLNLA